VIMGMVRAMMRVIHWVFPVEPNEIGGKRAETQIQPEGVIEAEGGQLGADVGVGRGDQTRRREGDIQALSRKGGVGSERRIG
jgi:hypothetical protein